MEKTLDPDTWVIGPSFAQYESAPYQQDFIVELKLQSNNFYHHTARGNLSFQNLLRESGFFPQEIYFNHGWLNDDNSPSIAHGNLEQDWSQSQPAKKVLMLNKEYARLEEKLNYISQYDFDLVVSHSPILNELSTVEQPHLFLPLAVDPKKLSMHSISAIYDRPINLYFSGILKNPFYPDEFSGERLEIQKKLFHCIGDFPVLKKFRYRAIKLYWKPFYFSRVKRFLSNIFHGRKKTLLEYYETLAASKLIVHTPSPAQIISTRIIEAMASGSVLVVSSSCVMPSSFKEGIHYYKFSSIDELIFHLEGSISSKSNTEYALTAASGRSLAIKENTWKSRVEQIREALIN